MEKEDLLKPRYKVIADYPDNNYKIGDLLIPKLEDNFLPEWFIQGKNRAESWLNQYPHLFKKLEWWEERRVEDMPSYAIDLIGRNENPQKVVSVLCRGFRDEKQPTHLCLTTEDNACDASTCLPVSESEFLNQQK